MFVCFSNQLGNVWIGLNDKGHEGQWVWLDGSELNNAESAWHAGKLKCIVHLMLLFSVKQISQTMAFKVISKLRCFSIIFFFSK